MSLLRSALILSLLISASALKAQTPGCPPNLNFEAGDLSNWHFFTGNCCPISAPTNTGAQTNRHVLTSGAGIDMYGGFPVVAPGGMYSLKLGNNQVGAQAERARYYVHVPTGSTKYILIYRYAVVFEDPGHPVAAQPRFEVVAYDSATGTQLPCANYSFVAASGIQGFVQSTVSPYPWYKDWTTASLDLSDFAGKTVAVDFSTGDCGAGAHFGYGYVDLDCKLFESYTLGCGNGGSINVTAPPGFQAYTWYSPGFGGVIGTQQTIAVSSPGVTNIYPVVLTPYPGLGCPDTLFAEVRSSIITSNASPDTVICDGKGEAQLDAKATGTDGPLTYSWQPSLGLSCTTCPNPYATVQSTMSYVVTMTDTLGCSKTDTAHIVIAPTIHTNIDLPDTVCQNSQVLVRNATPDTFSLIHYWDVGLDGKIVKGNLSDSVIVIWEQPGLKKVLLRAKSNVCEVYDSAFVYVRSSPKPFFQASAVYTCVGDTVSLDVQNDNGFYYWSIDDQEISETGYTSPVILSWQKSGEKKIKLGLKADEKCPVREYSRSVFVRDYPDATISVRSDICIGGMTSLSAKAHPDYIYDWRPVLYFLSNSTNDVQAEIPAPGFVTLQITDRWHNKCVSRDSVYLSPKHCCDILFPDAFTPNDDGINDLFRMIDAGKSDIFSFMVTNRWGKILYKSDSRNAGWDGTYNGRPQDGGMYMYYLNYLCDKEERVKKGSFLLIR